MFPKIKRSISPLLVTEFLTWVVPNSFGLTAAICFSVVALLVSEGKTRRAELPKLEGHKAFLFVVCPLMCWDIHLSACPFHRYTLGHSRLQEITCLATEFPLCVFFKYVGNYSLELSFFIHKLIIMKPNNDPWGKNHMEWKGSDVEWGCWRTDIVPGSVDTVLSRGSVHWILWLEAIFRLLRHSFHKEELCAVMSILHPPYHFWAWNCKVWPSYIIYLMIWLKEEKKVWRARNIGNTPWNEGTGFP